MRRPLLPLLALATSICALAASAVAQVRVVGSDLVKTSLEGYLARPANSALSVQLDLSGSQPALALLRAGKAEGAIILDSPGAAADYQGLRRTPLAYLAAVFIVNERNPVTSVTTAQLRGLFGAEETAKLNRWGELAAGGEWSNRNITVRTVAPRVSLTYDFFRHTVLATPRMRPNTQTEDSTEALFRALQQDVSSIGLSPVAPPANSGLKVLSVSGGSGETPFPPSLENIHVGDYKYRMSLEVVYTGETHGKLRSLMQSLYSDAFAEALEQGGLIPLPADLRKQLLADWK